MKKAESYFFKPIDGSAPLSIYFYDVGHLGDAIEAKNETGIGWFSPNGEILAVQFDEVDEGKDKQHLEFDHYRVDVSVHKGRIVHSVIELPKKKLRTSKKKTNSPNKAA